MPRSLALILVLLLTSASIGAHSKPPFDLRAEWAAGAAKEGPFVFQPGEGALFGPLRLVQTAALMSPKVKAGGAAELLEVVLWNDDVVGGQLGQSGKDAVVVQAPVEPPRAEGGSEIEATVPLWSVPIPLDALKALSFPARRFAAGTEEMRAPAKGDRLYRLVGAGVDVLDGTLDGIEAAGVAFESRLGRRVHPWSEVVALFVEPLDPPESTRGRAAAVSLDLVGGARLHGVLEALDPGRLQLRLPWDASIEVAQQAVLLVTADDDRIAYLSSLVPASIEGGSAFGDDLGLVFQPRFDRAIHGGILTCGGRAWARGIGVQSPATLSYRTEPGAFRRLRGAVGIDDSTTELAARGAVIFVVRGDGEELWRSEVVRGGRAPVELPVLDVSKIERLELIVEMGPELNLGDRANWLDLRLER